MIYIFEDRDSRKNLFQDKLNNYGDVICFAKFDIDEGQDLSDFIIERFCEAECIIFHKSYTFKDKHVNLQAVQTFMLNNGIKFCVFSGGIERGSINSDGVAWVNANVMYDNILTFTEHYKHTTEISLEALLWGNKNRLNQLISLQYDLFEQFFINNGFNDLLPSEDLDEVLDDIQRKFEDYGFDITEMLDKIHIVNESGLTWKELYENLHSVINKIEQHL